MVANLSSLPCKPLYGIIYTVPYFKSDLSQPGFVTDQTEPGLGSFRGAMIRAVCDKVNWVCKLEKDWVGTTVSGYSVIIVTILLAIVGIVYNMSYGMIYFRFRLVVEFK